MKKRIPSKSSNYASLIEDNAYYVDKTRFITELESLTDKYVFFLRPRRFGKSLTLSMLGYYYGIQHKERFDELFGQYFIGNPANKTILRNSYHILSFNFSGVETEKRDLIVPSFINKLINGIDQFKKEYGILDNAELEEIYGNRTAVGLLEAFVSKLKQKGFNSRIYLLIDEYDHFTNELFAFDREHFSEVVSRNGWVRKFYEVIKQLMGEGLIDRFFATGVTPVTLDSMTSGFNVAKNITLDSVFHNMAGFTENELRLMIENTFYEDGNFEIDSVISTMRSWYNGSKFSSGATEKLYNPQMVVSFLSEFSRNCKYPNEMADINVTSDYKKIANILSLLPVQESDSIIQEILSRDSISEKLTTQFNFELPYTRVEAISLLFYNGLLTIENDKFQVYDFAIPNHVIKVMYWEYFRYLFESRHNIQYESVPMRDALIEMSETGGIIKLLAYVHSILKNLSNRDLQKFSEKNIKMIFMTLLMGNNAYFVKSEHENREGYADLLLIPTQLNPGKENFLLELKYLKRNSKENLETELDKASAQVKIYKNQLALEGLICRTFAIVFVGKSGFRYEEVI